MTQETKRAVIVTGGSRGIGAEIVRILAARDIPVCFNYVTRPDEANALAQELKTHGHRFCMVQADVADPESVKRMFEQADQQLGQLGGLVNNAGFVGMAGRRIDTVDIETLRKTFDVNVIGPIVCAQEALKRLSTKRKGLGGRIINVSSIAARTGSPNDWVDYAASKADLLEKSPKKGFKSQEYPPAVSQQIYMPSQARQSALNVWPKSYRWGARPTPRKLLRLSFGRYSMHQTI
jgi:NAD(P)-dependent dehydrogenase (short-subunit alcohol dehydrogenase family)